MVTQFVLRKQKKNKAGECPVYLLVYFDGARLAYSTGEKCKPADWNADRQQFRRSYPLAEEANQLLARLANEVLTWWRGVRAAGTAPTNKRKRRRSVFGQLGKPGGPRPLGLLLGMLLFLLDALSAIGEGEALILLFKFFFLGLLPVILLLALWWHRLGKQFDREPKAPRVRPPITDAGSGKRYLPTPGLGCTDNYFCVREHSR